MTISPSAGVVSSALETASATESTTSIRSVGKPSSTAAVAMSSGSSARAFGGRAHTSCSTSSSPSAAQHLARLLLAQQSDDERARRRRELLGERAPQGLGSGDVVRAVEQHERMAADELEASGRPHACERAAHRVGIERRADERLRRGQRDRGVVALMRAVQRHEHVGVARHRA